MGFTYNANLSSNRNKVRFYIGDTTSGAGPKPADGNFDDAEIDGLITAEGSWQRAVAAGFEVLAGIWARHVTFKADDHQVSRSDTAKVYSEQAKDWRKRYGIASGSGTAGSRAVTRVDGYSQDVDSHEV